MYLNKAFIVGNLTKDPELKAIASGSKVCTFGVATNRVYKDKDGNRQENVEYHNIVAWGRTAELVAQYMKKGNQILVEGRIQTRSWDAQDGTKKYRTEIVADSIQFGNRPSGSGAGANANAGASASIASDGAKDDKAGADGKTTMPGETIEYPTEEIKPEDIPF